MNDIEFQTKNLLTVIKKSNVFHQYHRLRNKIASDPELYSRLNAFRKDNFLLQIQGSASPQEDSNAIMTEYSELLNNPMIAEFLVSERRLCRMLREINIKLFDNLDLDLTHLK